MHSILGSETEFGLASKSQEDRRRICRMVDDKLSLPPAERGDKKEDEEIADLVCGANWWLENLENGEEDGEKADAGDILRRLGMSGEYLKNGARFYVDGSHIEYSTPECADPWELVAHEKAGEIIAERAAEDIKRSLGADADLLKRNADYGGVSYACHGNYLVSRKLFGKLVRGEVGATVNPEWISAEQAIWVTHLMSSQIFTGAGRIVPDKRWPECFILSQRQGFITHLEALGTTSFRSIINTRDRPYADPKRFGRLHVICADSNRADWSNILKYGTSRLVLAMLEDFERCGNRRDNYLFATSPVSDFRSLRGAESLIGTEGGSISALTAQRNILNLVDSWCANAGFMRDGYSWARELTEMWKLILDLLESKDDRIYRLLDFFIKERMLEESVIKRGSSDDNRAIRSLEHNYHLVRRGGFFERLVSGGFIERLIDKSKIERALSVPPQTTRAKIRSLLHAVAIRSSGKPRVSWHTIGVRKDSRVVWINMPDPSSLNFEIKTEDDFARLLPDGHLRRWQRGWRK